MERSNVRITNKTDSACEVFKGVAQKQTRFYLKKKIFYLDVDKIECSLNVRIRFLKTGSFECPDNNLTGTFTKIGYIL